MKFLTTDLVKAQLRLDDDTYTLEKTLIEDVYAAGAEDTVLSICNQTYDELIETYTTVPPAIVNAALLLTVHSYEHRSPASPSALYNVPYTFDAMVKPYIIL